MKIIITGGCGYIGSCLAVDLIHKGDDVIIIDNGINSNTKFVTQNIINNISDVKNYNLQIFEANLCDINDLNSIKNNCLNTDVVVHIAALKCSPESVQKPLLYYNNNIVSTTNVLNFMKDIGCNKLVFASSASVYKESNTRKSETHDLYPSSPYGWSKLFCEQIIKDFCNVNQDFKAIILRYFNPAGASMVYNIGEDTPIAHNVIPIFARKIAKCINSSLNSSTNNTVDLYVFGKDYNTHDGSAIRDYIHIDDITHANVQAIQRLIQLNTQGYEIYNVGTEQEYSVVQIIESFKQFITDELKNDIIINTVFKDKRDGDVAYLVSNSSKAIQSLKINISSNLYNICKSALHWELNKK